MKQNYSKKIINKFKHKMKKNHFKIKTGPSIRAYIISKKLMKNI